MLSIDKFTTKEYNILKSDENLPDDIKQLMDTYVSPRRVYQPNEYSSRVQEEHWSQLFKRGIIQKAQEVKKKYGIF